jgi:hypothetical protein
LSSFSMATFGVLASYSQVYELVSAGKFPTKILGETYQWWWSKVKELCPKLSDKFLPLHGFNFLRQSRKKYVWKLFGQNGALNIGPGSMVSPWLLGLMVKYQLGKIRVVISNPAGMACKNIHLVVEADLELQVRPLRVHVDVRVARFVVWNK